MTKDQRLLFRGGCRLLCWSNGLRFRLRRFYLRQHRRGSCPARNKDGQHNRGHHEDNRRPGSCLTQRTGRAAWAEGRLAAHAAEGGGNIARAAALQQDNDDNEKANNNMNDGDQYNHLFQTTRPAQPALSRLKGKNSGTEWGFRKVPFCHLPFHLQLNCNLRFHPNVYALAKPRYP